MRLMLTIFLCACAVQADTLFFTTVGDTRPTSLGAVSAGGGGQTIWSDPNSNSLFLRMDFQTKDATYFYDASTNSFNFKGYPNITTTGPTQYMIAVVNGRTNYGAIFNGQNECSLYSHVTMQLASTNWTESVWFWTTNNFSATVKGYIYSHTGQRDDLYQSSGDTNYSLFVFGTTPNSYYGPRQTNMANGTWHNITVTTTATNQNHAYYDGVLFTNYTGEVCTNLKARADTDSVLGLVFGGGAAYAWVGIMDEYKVYTIAETAGQVANRVAQEHPTNNWVGGWGGQ